MSSNGGAISPPLGLLAELTHRCPLACPYCSNPFELESRTTELDTETWSRVMREAAQMGVLQIHLSGGEPASRRDLEAITRVAHDHGLYTNLITSAVGVTPARMEALANAGLDHVQISIQDSVPKEADRVAG
jgi:pyrroloquinoline quinone biosynthesis protein E